MKYFIVILLNILLTNLLAAQIFNFDFDFKREIKPSIRLDYGIDYSVFRQTNKDNLTSSLYSFGIDLGSATSQDFYPIETPIKYIFKKEFHMARAEKQLYNENLSANSFWGIGASYLIHCNEIEHTNISSIFVIGPVDLEGAGYKFTPNMGLKLLTGKNITWYWIDHTNVVYPEFPEEEPIYNNYADISYLGSAVRFGRKYHSEVAFQVLKGVSICGSARRMVVFPRTIFWKWVGSDLIFAIGGGVLDSFTDEIKKSSPYLYPVVDFILKTGLNYGITELQKKKMNWPFNTAAPLMIDQYKVGLQFEF